MDQMPRSGGSTRSVVPEIVFVVALVAVLAVALGLSLRNENPFEDAAMLFRYSENLADGHGVVYNPGGEHVDGASDLAFMVVVGGGAALGLDAEDAAAVLNVLALGAIVALVHGVWRRWGRIGAWASLAPPALMVVGPVVLYAISGFGTLVFAALVAGSAAMVEGWCRADRSTAYLVATGVWLAAMGMDRVEGFALAVLFLAMVAWRRRRPRDLMVPLAVLAAVGLAWFGWRTLYFGYPLPNPFYKKGGGSLYLGSLWPSVSSVVVLALPWLTVLGLGAFWPTTRRRSLGWLGVAGAWALMWVLLSNEMNFLSRFQYPIVPALAIGAASLYPDLRSAVDGSDLARITSSTRLAEFGLVVALVVLMVPSRGDMRAAVEQTGQFGRVVPQSTLADALASVGPGTETVATTEAGIVALRSGWYVLDLWGLNDEEIAHSGYLTPDELAARNPSFLVLHVPTTAGSSDPDEGAADFLDEWTQMSSPLLCFVDREGFEIVAQDVVGPGDAFVLLARSGDPRIAALRASLLASAVPFEVPEGGARLPVPQAC